MKSEPTAPKRDNLSDDYDEVGYRVHYNEEDGAERSLERFVNEANYVNSQALNPSMKRYRQKISKIFFALANYRFLDERGIALVLGMEKSASGQKTNLYPFLKKMEKDKLLLGFNKEGVSGKLYMLSKKGRGYGIFYHQHLRWIFEKLPTAPTKISAVRALHDLEFAKFAERMMQATPKNLNVRLRASRQLGRLSLSKLWGLIPDGVLTYQCALGQSDVKENRVAIEFERTAKKPVDRLWLFKRYEQAIMENQIQEVVFCFANKKTRDLYRKDFLAADKKPVKGRYDKTTKKVIPTFEMRWSPHVTDDYLSKWLLENTLEQMHGHFRFITIDEPMPVIKELSPPFWRGGIINANRHSVTKTSEYQYYLKKNPEPIELYGLSDSSIQFLKSYFRA